MTKKKTKIQNKTAPKGLTSTPCATNAQAKQAFIKAVEEDSKADVLAKVSYCLDYLCSSGKASFTESDLFTALRQWEIEDFQEVRRLFAEWVSVMEGLSKITVLRSCAYDEVVIIPVG